MILDSKQKRHILRCNPGKHLVATAQEYTRRLMMHNTGLHVDNYIEKMDYYERAELLSVRKTRAKSNKDVCARVHRPVDKVYNARGGSVYYHLPESQLRTFRGILKQAEYNLPLRKWIETFYRPAYHYDPMGLIFMEVKQTVGKDGTLRSQTFPTYKSVLNIYDYQLSGRKPEYVVFNYDSANIANPKEGVTYYRLVDDATDEIIAWDGKDYKQIKDLTYLNAFGQVPALIISDLYDPQRGIYMSPDDEVIELLDQYLFKDSVLNVHEALFGFPQQWGYAGICPTCKGTKSERGDTCSACNGSGIKTKYDVSERINLPVPQTKDDPILAPAVAGYIQPAVEGATWMADRKDSIYASVHWTYWGTHQVEDNSAQTATGRFIDVQPVNERLNKFSDAAEQIELFITDKYGSFYFPKTYGGADINYGRRYLIETPDALWDKYNKAKTAGATAPALDDMLDEYYQTRYANDSFTLERFQKLMKLEPLVHVPITDALPILQNSPDKLDYYKKLYFAQWVNQLQFNDLHIYKSDQLQTMLSEYVEEKIKTEANTQPPNPLKGEPLTH